MTSTDPIQPPPPPGAPPELPLPVPAFSYTGQSEDGRRAVGEIEAPDGDAALRKLQSQMHLRVTDLRPAARLPLARPISGDAFLAFNQQLAQLTRAGLPVEQGLRLIAVDLRRGRLARTVAKIAAELENGTPLGEAFDKHRGEFPSLYGRLIDAGVRGGNLPAVLLNLGKHLELQQRVRGVLWRTFSYPLMVLTGVLLVTAFIGWTVLPQFRMMFTEFHMELPAITVALLGFASAAPYLVGGAVVFGILALLFWIFARATGRDRAASDRLLLPLPLVGPILKRNLIARWLSALQIAVSAGLDLPAGIELAADATASPALNRDGAAMIAALKNGDAISTVRTRLLPATVPAAIEFGSANHDLPTTLETLSDLYQRQAELRLERVPAILTPLLVILVAILIGFVIFGILAPMFYLVRGMTH